MVSPVLKIVRVIEGADIPSMNALALSLLVQDGRVYAVRHLHLSIESTEESLVVFDCPMHSRVTDEELRAAALDWHGKKSWGPPYNVTPAHPKEEPIEIVLEINFGPDEHADQPSFSLPEFTRIAATLQGCHSRVVTYNGTRYFVAWKGPAEVTQDQLYDLMRAKRAAKKVGDVVHDALNKAGALDSTPIDPLIQAEVMKVLRDRGFAV